MSTPPRIVVMGVTGSGKSTLGFALAARLGLAFREGDDLHSAASRAKMAGGTPLDDADRWPWLDRVGGWLRDRAEAGGVISCSALKRVYRDRLRATAPGVRFVLPRVDRAVLVARFRRRSGHFMPVSLIDSQFATLELPDADEDVISLDAGQPVADMVAAALRALAADGV